MNNSLYAGDSSQPKSGLYLHKSDQRQTRLERDAFENEYKLKFYENLKDQIEKRINQVKF